MFDAQCIVLWSKQLKQRHFMLARILAKQRDKKAHLLTGVTSSRRIFTKLAFEVVDRDNLHHNTTLGLFLQVEIPGGGGVRPVELVPLQGERCGSEK